jgi:uncharacterized membrane protein YozB (DUF420 family)
MTVSAVLAIIALIVALVAICVALNTNMDSGNQAESNAPTSEEGRKIAVVRGTAWVSSTQITVWTNNYTTGG